jgi:hypothetical protein
MSWVISWLRSVGETNGAMSWLQAVDPQGMSLERLGKATLAVTIAGGLDAAR